MGMPAWSTSYRLHQTDAMQSIRRKQKVADLQNGHVYLTSHRLCYVDDPEPRKNSVTVALKGIDHCEFYVRLKRRFDDLAQVS